MTLKTNYDLFLFLDDERIPSKVKWVDLPQGVEWTIARNYDEFVKIITEQGIPAFITFDHDLADEHYTDGWMASAGEIDKLPYEAYKEKTGLECAKWLVGQLAPQQLPFPLYEVHTMNPIGKMNIQSYIRSYIRSTKGYDHE